MSTRRSLLLAPFALAAQTRTYSHRLPPSDQNYARSSGYIEDTPIPDYRWASAAAYERFHDMKFGVRIHWGLYSILQQRSESWPFLKMSYAARDKYNQMYRSWNPRNFDANEWMSFFASAGMKMFAFTTKHHEGFSMFHTKTRVRRRIEWSAPGGPRIEDCDLAYGIEETPFRRDIVKELCDAAHRHGIKIDLYFSHSDWYDADFRPYGYHPAQVPSSPQLTNAQAPQNDPPELERARGRMGSLLWTAPDPSPEETRRMLARHRAQLLELVSNYGAIDMLCLDIWLGKTVWPELRQTLLEIRKRQPDVMLRARGIGNYGDYYTPENFVPAGKEASDVPWFVIHKLGPSFSYEADPKKYKGAPWVIHNLIDAVAKGGNFMVGIGPDPDGRFHPTAIAQLKEVGAWLKVNGEGIYGTRARDAWKEDETVRLVRSRDSRFVYAHCLAWPGAVLRLNTVRWRKGAPIHLLGYPEALKVQADSSGEIAVQLPEAASRGVAGAPPIAWTVRIPVS
ncbi:MAG: alpha-L-fucosidase [Bryobacterales bacterium]|nr:alpha-L-fucosidase [Bryobacterales bacterium]